MQIPVGPVHAGVIEPGHFRFSAIGETIFYLEPRLFYTHKGTEKRFEGMDLATGAKLAGRVSGDTHSAYDWAYCMAVEAATGSQVPERAVWLRALFLEIERIANHLGDLGYLGNDVALSFGFMQFWRLKEDWLRLSAKLFGHRYLFDCIVPGGVAVDIDNGGMIELGILADRIEAEVRSLTCTAFAGHGRKVLTKKTVCDVRIPSGYHTREPLDWSQLVLRYVLLRQNPDFQESLDDWKSQGTPRHAGFFAPAS